MDSDGAEALAGLVGFCLAVVFGAIALALWGLWLLLSKVIYPFLAETVYPAIKQWWWERNREKRIREAREQTQKEIGQVAAYYVRLHKEVMQVRR